MVHLFDQIQRLLSNEKAMMISAIVLAVLGVICLFAMPPFGVILLAGAAVWNPFRI